MLVTNSEERATIQQIFDESWFQLDLPEYLISATAVHMQGHQGRENTTQLLDETIVTKVAEVPPITTTNLTLKQSLGYPLEDVIAFLSEPRDNSAKKAYNLIVETEAIHQFTENAQKRGLTKNSSFLSASPPPWNQTEIQHHIKAPYTNPLSPKFGNLHMTLTSQDTPEPHVDPVEGGTGTTSDPSTNPNKRSKISLLMSSYPAVHARLYSPLPQHIIDENQSIKGINLEPIPPSIKVHPSTFKRKRQNYHFGIRSRGQGALEVIQEIYKALERMGAEWAEKLPHPDSEDPYMPQDPFTIKCRFRKKYPQKSVNSKSLQGEDDMYVYMEIQLYEQPDPNDYLVDFKWVRYELLGRSEEMKDPGDDGVQSAFPYLDLASTLIAELAKAA
jgi:Adenylate sensor of SNF1-like protein kinase